MPVDILVVEIGIEVITNLEVILVLGRKDVGERNLLVLLLRALLWEPLWPDDLGSRILLVPRADENVMLLFCQQPKVALIVGD